MNKSNYYFAISASLSAYLFILGIPSLIAPQKVASLVPKPQRQAPEPQAPAPQNADPVALLPFDTLAIEIKASGEDPLPPDDDLRDYLAAASSFEDRFGHSFSAAWEARDPLHHDFSTPKELEGMVYFWTQVFGRYEKNDYIFHHADSVDIVYSAISLGDLEPLQSGLNAQEADRVKKQTIAEEKARIKKMLKQLADGKKNLSKDERRIMQAFTENPDISLDKAWEADNLRLQPGFAHRFKKAIEISGSYLPEMENIFSMREVPVEITRLAFIESAFNFHAESSAKAVGLWQFIPDTGKRYLKINEYVDERKDPILSTIAAAQHLKNEYALLGSWPLAINAYNTGPGRIIQAKKLLKTNDIATIIKKFHGSGYKFYSRNYYPEFLAALHVYEHQEEYFGLIEKQAPLQYDIFSPTHDLNMASLLTAMNISPVLMKNLNPSLRPKVMAGTDKLPAGSFVRVPKQMGRQFALAATEHYQMNESTRWHIANQGESLRTIASRYQVDMQAIEQSNQFLPHEIVPEGTMIEIPQKAGVAFQPQ